MDLGITDRVALITGGDSGIGWHTARMLLDEGATVVLADRDQDKLEAATDALDAPPGTLHGFPCDVRDLDSLARLREQVHAAVGPVEILVHCAGVTGATGPFHEVSDDGWVSTLETDLLGPVRTVRTFLEDLRACGHGRIVLLSSENGVQPYDDEVPYDTAKAGILALAKGISRTYAREGLLVNCVSPAFIHTPMTDAMMNRRADELGVSRDEAIRTFLDEKRPFLELKRRGEPDEVAAVICFLCSERASFVTGSNYRVDGGSVATI